MVARLRSCPRSSWRCRVRLASVKTWREREAPRLLFSGGLGPLLLPVCSRALPFRPHLSAPGLCTGSLVNGAKGGVTGPLHVDFVVNGPSSHVVQIALLKWIPVEVIYGQLVLTFQPESSVCMRWDFAVVRRVLAFYVAINEVGEISAQVWVVWQRVDSYLLETQKFHSKIFRPPTANSTSKN